MRDTKERILQVALDLFARSGYEHTGLTQIAKQVGITKPALYYYFHSKEELYAELLDRFIVDVRAKFVSIPAGGSPEEQLRALLTNYVEMMHERYDLLQVVSRDFFGEGTAVLGLLATRVQEQVLEPVQSVLRSGIELKAFRRVDPGLTSLSILGAVHAYLAEFRLTGKNTPVETFVDHTVSLLLAGLHQHA
jgi:AcrR family transcriptional regulator